jgi:hypothetical protein
MRLPRLDGVFVYPARPVSVGPKGGHVGPAAPASSSPGLQSQQAVSGGAGFYPSLPRITEGHTEDAVGPVADRA